MGAPGWGPIDADLDDLDWAPSSFGALVCSSPRRAPSLDGPVSFFFSISRGRYCGDAVPYSWVHYGQVPRVLLPGATETRYYTMAIVDPDAPGPTEPFGDAPALREIAHYLVGNIAGYDLQVMT